MFYIQKDIDKMTLEEAQEALIYILKKYLVGYGEYIENLPIVIKDRNDIPMRGISENFRKMKNEMRNNGIQIEEMSNEDKALYQDLIDWYAN